MLELVSTDGELIAIFIGAGHSVDRTRFITPNREPLQLGVGFHAKGSAVPPHCHRGVPATVSEFQEFIQVRRGRVIADVYDTKNEWIKSFEMGAGDALLLLRGGHGFRFLEDTEFLELKQGPYLGRETMKRMLDEGALVRRPEVGKSRNDRSNLEA